MNDHLLWLRGQRSIRGSARAMLFALCDHADENGEWDWPSTDGPSGMTEWATQAGLSRGSAIRARDMLIEAGVVVAIDSRTYRIIDVDRQVEIGHSDQRRSCAAEGRKCLATRQAELSSDKTDGGQKSTQKLSSDKTDDCLATRHSPHTPLIRNATKQHMSTSSSRGRSSEGDNHESEKVSDEDLGTVSKLLFDYLVGTLRDRGMTVTITNAAAAASIKNIKRLLSQHEHSIVVATLGQVEEADISLWPWKAGPMVITSASGFDSLHNAEALANEANAEDERRQENLEATRRAAAERAAQRARQQGHAGGRDV